MKKAIILLACMAMFLCYGQGKRHSCHWELNGIQKVMLLISTAETAKTRLDKPWVPPAPLMTLQSLPYSSQDMSDSSPEEAVKMFQANHEQRLANQGTQAELALFACMMGTINCNRGKNKLKNVAFGSQMCQAIDKFSSMAGEYFDPNCIDFRPRVDNDQGSQRIFLENTRNSEIVIVPFFLRLLFEEPVIKPEDGQKRNVTQTISCDIMNMDGNIISSKAETISKAIGPAPATEDEEDTELVNLMAETLASIAASINKFFVAKTSIKLFGPQNDVAFDPRPATVTIDRTQYGPDEEISILKGNHVIAIDLDGYRQADKHIFFIQQDGPISLTMEKTGK